MHNKKGIKTIKCLPMVSADRARPDPAAPRHFTLLPPKYVSLFLPKCQGKETEIVNMCMIKRE